MSDTLKISDEIMAKRKTNHQLRVEAMQRIIRMLSGSLPDIPETPTVPQPSMILKQAKLIFEEMFELFEACGVAVTVPNAYISSTATYEPKDFKLVTQKLPDNEDLPHIAKEIADLSVVTTGMFIEFGMCDTVILEEVDRNNLAKFGEGGYLDENRKWRKPPNHPVPDLEKCLKDQGWATEETVNEKEGFSVPG